MDASIRRLRRLLLVMLAGLVLSLAPPPAAAQAGSATVVAWGSNDYGQTNVPAGLSDVVAIAAGTLHTVALVGTASNTPPRLRVTSGTCLSFTRAQASLALHVSDAESPAASLTLTAHSSNQTLLPNFSILLSDGGIDASRSLSFRTRPGQSGDFCLTPRNGALEIINDAS